VGPPLEALTLAEVRLGGDPGTFYEDVLGFDDGRVGASVLSFSGAGAAFYHFAFLVPGDRFAAARAWAAERVELLTTIDFPAWDAQACYFHDPAGNIVELIAHGGIGAAGRSGAFAPAELLAISELGLVGVDAGDLEAFGLPAWDRFDPLVFCGRRAHTLIATPAGRGWLPTGRPAEVHPAEVGITGLSGELRPAGLPYRLYGVG
jgi:catechol 2,3-dioxygenase-like lactoylglutathione lyase family enzyme